MSNNDDMYPMSGEPVEVDGVYANEWGREELLKRGQIFPADKVLGTTSWQLIAFPVETNTKRAVVDEQFRDESDDFANKHNRPRKHIDRGDK